MESGKPPQKLGIRKALQTALDTRQLKDVKAYLARGGDPSTGKFSHCDGHTNIRRALRTRYVRTCVVSHYTTLR